MIVFLFFRKKYFEKSNANLFCNDSIISSLFKQFSLIIKYNKSKVFHFSKIPKKLNPSPLDLRYLENVVLRPKDT